MPNGRCYLHGGASTGPPKGTQNALTHGIYASGYLDDEEALLADLEKMLGTLDSEIHIVRLQLRRTLRAQKVYEEGDEESGFKLAERRIGTKGGVEESSEIRKHPDYQAIIDRCVGRISHLERIRSDLKVLEAENLIERLQGMLGNAKAAVGIEP